MKNQDAFSRYHPVVSFLFFAQVPLFTMCWQHPLDLLIALIGGVVYHLRLCGGAALWRQMKLLLPLCLLSAAVNALGSHVGQTVLLYWPSGAALTLEALLCGAATGGMIAAALAWFACCSCVMTPDKLWDLFGRCAPTLGLLLSMTLRFVPALRRRSHALQQAQGCLGQEQAHQSLRRRYAAATKRWGMLLTWSLEDAMETADSMKARGYGLPHRSAFRLRRFTRRDGVMLLWLLICFAALCVGWWSGAMAWQYYPTLHGAPLTALTLLLRVVYLALVMTPVAVDVAAQWRWR